MGERYLTALAVWARAAGLVVHEDPGWQYRARSSGGFDGDRPWCVMWHHTASRTSPENDVNYICRGSPDAPIANLLLDRTGAVWVCAGGATNTNGKGGPFTVSRGVVPADSMNTYAVSIEAANDGVGEPWPVAQIDAFFALSLALTAGLDLEPDDTCHHHVWAPDRKIDPATADAVAGNWWPAPVNPSGSWSLADTHDELDARAGHPPDPGPEPSPGPDPAPPLPPEEDDMQRITAALDTNGTIWVGDGIERYPLSSMDEFNNRVILGVAGCFAFVNTNGDQIREVGHVQEVSAVTLAALGRER